MYVGKYQSRHVLRNNASRCLRRTMVRITSDVTWDSRTAGQPDSRTAGQPDSRKAGKPESRTAGITNKVLEAGVQTSYVHSSIKALTEPSSLFDYTSLLKKIVT